MSKQKKGKKNKKKSMKWRNLIAGIGIIVTIIVIAVLVPTPNENEFTAESVTEQKDLNQLKNIGPASHCQKRPFFVDELGFTPNQINIATALQGFMGFTMFDQVTGQVYQHESWDDAGFLGNFARDEWGNIYIYATPSGSTENNPPEEQNKVYVIDSRTRVMSEWLDLPALQAPTPTVNPFGITGIFYDCDTRSLYVTSVMGSTAQEENGRIFHIDVETREILDTFDNIDSLGIAVYNGVNGKRLYLGLARNSAMLSLELDEEGDFAGEPQRKFFLAELEGGGNERVHRITFSPHNQNMIVKGVEFDFTLRAAGVAEFAKYEFHYLPEDSWELVGVERSAQ